MKAQQTAQEVRPLHNRQSQTTQTSVVEKDLTHFSFIPRVNLPNALLEMDILRLSSLCHSLHIEASSPIESLKSYADRLDDTKYLFFLRLLNPVEVIDHSHRYPETIDSELIKRFDLGFRFRTEFATSVLAGPFFVGEHPYSESFSVKLSWQIGRRVIIQSINSSEVSFPKSLTIWIGDTTIVRGNALHSCGFLDITDMVVSEQKLVIEVQAQVEGQWFCIVIRQIEEVPFDELLSQVLVRRLEGESESCVCCPISKKVMKVPVRSRTCRHGQCMEFKALMETKKVWQDLVCPVCGEVVVFEDLATDWNLMQKLGSIWVKKQYFSIQQEETAHKTSCPWQ
jgi:hypothetical protein